MLFESTIRDPEAAAVWSGRGRTALSGAGDGTWVADGWSTRAEGTPDGMALVLEEAGEPVHKIEFSWRCSFPEGTRFLNDHWERGYGDMEWGEHRSGRTFPWYFLANRGAKTWAVGVMTSPSALVHWRITDTELTLVCDVRSGARGLVLENRELRMAVLKIYQSADETPFETARIFCRKLCPEPLLPEGPVYGFNDWHYGLGSNTRETVIRDTGLLAELSPDSPERPFFTIDAGWHICGEDHGGPWNEGNPLFEPMKSLSSRIKDLGVRPGIWVRPLRTHERVPPAWIKGEERSGRLLDPSIPEVLEFVRDTVRRFTEIWGFELVKHDFSTWDLLGLWGYEMEDRIAGENAIRFSDSSRTTAEIVLDLYRAIREGAGDALVIGCNTFSHLAAGLVHLQRTGDDTSAYDWGRTRKMGINTLAFRSVHHGAFYASDGDCVGITSKIPWRLNAQWLDLLSRSGMPVGVSPAPEAIGTRKKSAIREAFTRAVQPHPLPEPLDWMDHPIPQRWKIDGEEVHYHWS